MRKGWRGGGGDERWGRGGGVKVQKYISATQYRSREIFFIAKNFFVDDDSGHSAFGQTASGLNFYDNNGHSLQAN